MMLSDEALRGISDEWLIQERSRREIVKAGEALCIAVEEGSLEKLNEAVASGADVNFLSDKRLPGWKDSYVQKGTGNSALHLACWLGLDKAIIDRLLELGSDIHLKSLADGYLPIHTATNSGNVGLVELLLDKGCNPNAKDNSGSSPLTWSVFRDIKIKEIIKLLIDRGADQSARDNDGDTCLAYASMEGHKEVVEFLLARGADISDRDNNGYTCLALASMEGHKEVVEYLLARGADISDRNNDGHTCLAIASLHGHIDIQTLFRNWPVTMFIVVSHELGIYYPLDTDSFIDLLEFIGEERDYV